MIIAYLWALLLSCISGTAFAFWGCEVNFTSEQSHVVSWLNGVDRVIFNTSTDSKYNVFSRILPIPIVRNDTDVREIDADHLMVIAHKASQFEPKPGEIILVEDSSLEVDGADIGVHVKFRKHLLKDYIGRPARWDVLLAYRRGEDVLIFRGSVEGFIKDPEDGVGNFDGYFSVNPSQTISTDGSVFVRDQLARYIAVNALINNQVYVTLPVVKEWQGNFQNLQ